MATEIELKYNATPAVLAAMEAAISQPGIPYRMETTYYDTPTRALAARNITLRRRMENELSVCTLKAPAKEGRLEFELHRDSIEDAIPELCKLASIPQLPALLEQGVEPVCGARFDRVAKTVTYAGATIEIALDRGILTGGGREQPLCEVEFELKTGSVRDLQAYATVLAVKYGLQPEKRSKFARAMALAKGE